MRRSWRSFVAAAAGALLAGGLAIGAQTPSAPAAAGSSTCPWVGQQAPPAARAGEVVAQMTLGEKLSMLGGGTPNPGGYEGFTPAIPRLCIPALTQEDGPAGAAAGVTGVTQLPAPIAGAATWDRSLMGQYGKIIGNEEWGKGVEAALAPDINIARVPENGRTFEALGEDPYLASQMAVADINGIQSQGVIAQAKHFDANNQENNRGSVSENVDDRTLHEIYLPAFRAAVQQAHVGSLMCAYNKVNGTYSCENPYLLTDVLRHEWGFQGWVGSDYGATHSTVAAANAGLDMQMPQRDYFAAPLQQAVQNGQVSVATINAKVQAILTEMFQFGLFERQPSGNRGSVVTSPAHAATARTLAEDSAVLLKDSSGALPLDASKTHSIAVIGSDAGQNALTASPPPSSAHVNPPYVVTPLAGITNRAGSGTTVRYAQGDQGTTGAPPAVPSQYLTPPSGTGHGLLGQYFNNTSQSGAPVLTRTDPNIDFTWGPGSTPGSPGPGVNATNFSAKWTGTLTPPATGTYTFSLTSDDGSQLFVNGQEVVNDGGVHPPGTATGTVSLTAGQPVSIEVDYFQASGGDSITLGWQVPGQTLLQQAVSAAKASDVAVVFAADPEVEGTDLANLQLPGGDNQLISDVAAANPNTIVVLNTASPVTMPWLGQVKGVVEDWYPGQEDGNAIAAVLFGDVNPSGHLPVTFPTSETATPIQSAQQYPGLNGQADYSEKLDVGYRWYDAHDVTPLFPFGYGLSYTSFRFSDLRVTPPVAPAGPGGCTTGAGRSCAMTEVSADVTNTGSRAGSEVAQLYVGDPASAGEPPRQLKGFAKVTLQPGQTERVTFPLTRQDLSYWSTTANGWVMAKGTYWVSVGDSSASSGLPLQGSFQVARATGPQAISVASPATLGPGTNQVTVHFTNGSDVVDQHLAFSLRVGTGGNPDPESTAAAAWQVSPAQPVTMANLKPGQSATERWTVTVPPGAQPGTYQFNASVVYHNAYGPGKAWQFSDSAIPKPYGTATVSCVLAAANTCTGLSQLEEDYPGDGATQPVTIDGVSGRQTVPKYANDNNIYFNVDDSVANDGQFAATFTVEYYDQGNGTIVPQYDSNNPNGIFDGAYTNAPAIQETNTGTWKTATFTVNDGRFANRENGGADFRLGSTTPLTVHSVSVKISGQGVTAPKG